nr:HAD family hydrolase [Vibrio parahaemolyticus]
MTKIYLFDWGDTLMVDFPDQKGKMCDWLKVEAIDGAVKALRDLSKSADIYVATNAADSSENEIKTAFKRVGLDTFISGYFCKANLGVSKDSVEFFPKILNYLGVDAHEVTMVGDSLERDVLPAKALGLNVIWFNPSAGSSTSIQDVCSVKNLSEIST